MRIPRQPNFSLGTARATRAGPKGEQTTDTTTWTTDLTLGSRDDLQTNRVKLATTLPLRQGNASESPSAPLANASVRVRPAGLANIVLSARLLGRRSDACSAHKAAVTRLGNTPLHAREVHDPRPGGACAQDDFRGRQLRISTRPLARGEAEGLASPHVRPGPRPLRASRHPHCDARSHGEVAVARPARGLLGGLRRPLARRARTLRELV